MASQAAGADLKTADLNTVDLKTRALAALAAGLIRGLRATVRLRHHGDAEVRRREREDERFLIAFWHRHLLLMPYCYRGRRISVLISRHRDGELIARTMAHFGIDASRGSSTRGGSTGFRDLLRQLRAGSDLAITPDGPKGPASVVKPGVVQLAMMAGIPIQPVALGASRCWRLRSWDGFVIPAPGSRVALVYGELMGVSRRDDPELAAAALGERLLAAETLAEQLARGARPAGLGGETR